jgi:hypothetical protein
MTPLKLQETSKHLLPEADVPRLINIRLKYKVLVYLLERKCISFFFFSSKT